MRPPVRPLAMNIVDRRLNPKGKSHTNRQRFIRLARDTLKEAVARSIKERSLGDVDTKEVVNIPTKRIQEPRFHHAARGGNREHVLPGNKEFVQGDTLPKPEQGGGDGGGREGSPDGEGEDDFQFTLSRGRVSRHPVRRTRAAGPRQDQSEGGDGAADARAPATVTAARPPTSTSSAPCATAWRAASRCTGRRRPRSRRSKPRSPRPKDEARRAELKARLEQARAPQQIHRLHRSGRSPLQPLRADAQAQRPGRHVLPDGRVRLDERVDEGPRQAVLPAAPPLPVAQIRAGRRSSSSATPRRPRRWTRRPSSAAARPAAPWSRRRSRRCSASSPSAIRLDDWNIYAAQASDGDNYSGDSETCTRLLRDELLPLCQYFAYVEVVDEREAGMFRSEAQRERPLARLQGGRRRQRELRDAAGLLQGRHLPGLPPAVRQDAQGGLRCGWPPSQLSVPRAACSIETGEWNFDTLKRTYDAIEQIAIDELGLDPYPNQIEMISSEQMLDAYSSIGMPVFYSHWSFGKRFVARREALPQGLHRPRLRDRDQLQPLHLLHHGREHHDDAGAGHGARRLRPQPLLQEQLPVQGVDRRRGHPRLSQLRQGLCRALRGAARHRRRRARARCRPRAHGPGRQPLRPAPAPEPGRGEEARRRAPRASPEHLQRSVAHRADARPSPRRPSKRPMPPATGSACRKRTCSISSRNFRRACRTGSASWCASCASSRSTSTRRSRPR